MVLLKSGLRPFDYFVLVERSVAFECFIRRNSYHTLVLNFRFFFFKVSVTRFLPENLSSFG